ncbi:hypothetical protein HanXRQr2_Chr15g0699141 [Helianthus annuus]|uniref:Uncharacterized protein n=1 Tax=Helianthus annuus TaxID=4232 RepID=A0A9K3E103_HELAN|nr:hypothetical protein HanXRQr2_Chr15g0699141 [Helianthus annuus]KAJ0831765.1 hypothetical protein HanPSC8_Chr15g0670891 [Helianthus annuus]
MVQGPQVCARFPVKAVFPVAVRGPCCSCGCRFSSCFSFEHLIFLHLACQRSFRFYDDQMVQISRFDVR